MKKTASPKIPRELPVYTTMLFRNRSDFLLVVMELYWLLGCLGWLQFVVHKIVVMLEDVNGMICLLGFGYVLCLIAFAVESRIKVKE